MGRNRSDNWWTGVARIGVCWTARLAGGRSHRGDSHWRSQWHTGNPLMWGCIASLAWVCWPLASVGAAEPSLMIAVSSYRNRPMHPEILFYKVDASGNCLPSGGVTPVTKRSDHHPVFTADGKLCLFASESEGQPCVILAWDIAGQKPVDLPGLNESPHAQAAPAATGDGQQVFFEAWARPGFPGRWDLLRYDVKERKVTEVPGVNRPRRDERAVSVAGDGSRLVFTVAGETTRPTDLHLLDLKSGAVDALVEANSDGVETDPVISADGRYIAFISDRNAATSGPDVFLWDVAGRALVETPGLNSAGNEQAPALSPDGRYILFVSERLDGVGERDIFLYDRNQSRLLPLPGVNSLLDEMDPAIVVVP
jgi:Tol biopolymer transport system component